MSQTVDLTTFSYTVLSLLTAKAQPETLRSSLAPPIMSCVTLSELLNLSERQYSPLSNNRGGCSGVLEPTPADSRKPILLDF